MKRSLTCALLMFGLLSSPDLARVSAQQDAAKEEAVAFKLFASDNATDTYAEKVNKEETKYNLRVRPNAGEQNVYVSLFNPLNRERPYYVVAEINRVKFTATGKIKANGTELLRLAPVAAAAKPAVESKPADAKAPPPPAAGWAANTPLVVKAYYQEDDSKRADLKPAVLEIEPVIAMPESYVEVTPEIVPIPGSKLGKLRFKVSLKEGKSLQSPCKVELDLSYVTGLSNDSLKDANLLGQLDSENSTIILSLNNVKPANETELGGFFAITVDGVRRAFRFETKGKENTVPQRSRDNRNLVRIVVEKSTPKSKKPERTRFINPDDDNQRVTARLEVDDADKDAKLVYLFSPDNSEQFNRESQVGVKKQELLMSLGKEEDACTLRYSAKLQDHEKELSLTKGVTGIKSIKAELTNLKGDVKTVQSDRFEVVFDGSAPVIDSLTAMPTSPKQGGKVNVEVKASSPTTITRAYFFLGDAPDKEPALESPTWKQGKKTKEGTYVAELTMPADKKGPLALGVRVYNGVGEKADKPVEVVVQEAPAPSAATTAAKKGSLKVLVTQGGRTQPKVAVVLVNAKGEVAATKVTDEDGEALFDGLAAGVYVARSAKLVDKVTGNTGPVEVEADGIKAEDRKEAKEIKLSRTRS